jgi:hypothetical protein
LLLVAVPGRSGATGAEGCTPPCESGGSERRSTDSGPADMPGLIGGLMERLGRSCSAGFEIVTKAIMLSQPKQGNGSDDLLNSAKSALIGTGLFAAQEFDGLNIRWCALAKGINGLAPDPNVICISDVWLRQNDALETAISIAHEMIHIRQYRRAAGADAFRCAYTREFIHCGGRQEGCISFENEAYAFEDDVACPRLAAVSDRPAAGRPATPADAAAFCRKRASER